MLSTSYMVMRDIPKTLSGGFSFVWLVITISSLNIGNFPTLSD